MGKSTMATGDGAAACSFPSNPYRIFVQRLTSVENSTIRRISRSDAERFLLGENPNLITISFPKELKPDGIQIFSLEFLRERNKILSKFYSFATVASAFPVVLTFSMS